MTDLDFLPPQYHRARAGRRLLHRHAALFGLMLLSMLAWVQTSTLRTRRADAAVNEMQVQQVQVGGHRVAMESICQKRDDLLAEERLGTWLDDRVSWVVVLAELSRVQPRGVVLDEVRVGHDTDGQRSMDHVSGGRCCCDSCWTPEEGKVTISPGGGGSRLLEPPKPPPSAGAPIRAPDRRRARVILCGRAAEAPHVSDYAAGLTASRYFVDVLTLLVDRPPDRRLPGVLFQIELCIHPQVGGGR